MIEHSRAGYCAVPTCPNAAVLSRYCPRHEFALHGAQELIDDQCQPGAQEEIALYKREALEALGK